MLPAAGAESYRAHLQLLQAPGAGAWLHAPPCEALGLHLASPLFKVLVRMRLRLALSDKDIACPLCDGIADRFGDHARMCPCGGDRTKRHHRLRSVLAARAQAAGLSPEIEKSGLLPPRPEEHGGPEDGSSRGQSSRRPADVWVPSWGVHGPAAFDLAVTSGLRQGQAAASTADGSRAAAAYEDRKNQHLNTLSTCTAEGFQFLPLVAEACSGGWGPVATKTWKELAAAIAARSNESVATETERLLQSLAVALQRENARAVLRRFGE